MISKIMQRAFCDLLLNADFSYLSEHEVQLLLFEPFKKKVFYHQIDDTIYFLKWEIDPDISLQLTFNFEGE